MDHNRVHLIGRLVRDPKYFPPGRRGQEHATGTLAINRVVPNEEGPAADYIGFSVWGPEAARFCQLIHRGDEILILGRIRTNFVQRPDGTKVSYWEVRAEQIRYGRTALANLSAAPAQDFATRAVQRLTTEFTAESES